MVTFPDKAGQRFQQSFHERWGHLNNPHVRSLAWLLDAPDLLAPSAPQWKGMTGPLKVDFHAVRQWLTELDMHPQELDAWLNLHASYRLGRYAERLMAFYFTHQGNLIAHGLQLRGGNQETIGEFDFLLNHGNEVLHVELATKFYLLETSGDASGHAHAMDYFVGPNLADTLGLKVGKIIDKQLLLGQHPAARTQLSRPVDKSMALIKGWLFYHENDQTVDTEGLGLSVDHCKGFWCTISELANCPDLHYLVLPRLSWLPPAKAGVDQVVDNAGLLVALAKKFKRDTMPVLVAVVEARQGFAVEIERGFIVPDDWQTRAGQRDGRILLD